MDPSRTLSADEITPPLVPMREEMDPAAFRELVESVRARGLLQPLVVTPVDGKYRLIAGYRRWRACIEAGLLEIPVMVRQASEVDEVELMVTENLHREDAPPLDEARVFAILMEHQSLTIAQVAERIQKGPAYVAGRLAVFHGPADVRAALHKEQITLSVARELIRCTHDGDRAYFLHHAIAGGASADTVRRWISDAALRREQAGIPAAAPVITTPLEIPPVMMATCEWGRHDVPMERTLGFRVCGDCYSFLLQLRDQVARETAAAAEPERGG